MSCTLIEKYYGINKKFERWWKEENIRQKEEEKLLYQHLSLKIRQISR